jgi:muramoyltetrapeptide carboxypeptidase
MPRLLKPARLVPGQTIGVCCPASAPPDPTAIDRALAVLAGLGYGTRLAPHARDRHGFLAGSDRDRAGDLMRLFKDRRVDAIFCLRGGYGCTRLLDRLDFAAIRACPKILLGYSDVTALHCALLKRAGLITFHGPVLNSDFLREPRNAFTMDSLWRTIARSEPAGSVRTSSGAGAEGVPEPTVLRTGQARGRLVGGNLSLLCALVGTPWLPSLRGRLLFLEDVDEAPYRIDRMLTHLLAAGALRGVAGIAIGTNAGCEDPKRAQFNEYRQTAEDVFRERLAGLRVPVVCGLPFGHQAINATLPVGAGAELDGRRGDLRLLEAAVT